jgi:hypothetical protein
MNITPIVFFDMAGAILILALALVALVYHLSRITKSLHGNLNVEDGNSQKNIDPLDEARAKAVKIVDEANNQALDIVNRVTISTNVTAENFKENLSRVSSAQIKEFEKVTADFAKLYSQILQELKTNNVEVFQNASKEIETNTMVEVKNFKESMQQLTISAQKEVQEKINADYTVAKKEIEDYRKEELQKIDSGIYELLEKISKLVIGKTLSLSEHEDLIEKSLEKAKKEGAFR